MRRASRGRFVSPASFRDVSGASGGVGSAFEGADGSDAGGVVGWPLATGAGEAMVDEFGGDVRDQFGARLNRFGSVFKACVEASKKSRSKTLKDEFRVSDLGGRAEDACECQCH